MSEEYIRDAGSERKYWTQLPNKIDDDNLDPYEFRLYVHLKRVAGDSGRCWQNTQTLASHCRMSAGKVSQAKQALASKGLIYINTGKSDRGKPYHVITIVDIWPQNMLLYAGQGSPGEGITSPDEVISSCGEVISSPGEIKKNPLRRTREEEQLQQAQKPQSPSGLPVDQSDWDEQDHANFDIVLESWVQEFGKLTVPEVARMIGLWNEYPELEIHEYAWNEMIDAKAKRGVRPNLAYYEKCLATECRQNWIERKGGNNHGEENT